MDVPLIPRKLLFGNPDRTGVRLSPDGRYLSYLAPHEGVLNVWVAPREDPQAAQPVTDDRKRGVRYYTWAYTGQHLLYIQDKDGDENWHLYRVALDTRETVDLTPFDGVQARLIAASPERPEQLLIGLNRRDPRWHDLYRLELASGELVLLEENHRFVEYVADRYLQPRLAVAPTDDGGFELDVRRGEGWERWAHVPLEDASSTRVVGITPSGEGVYLIDSRGRNTAALVAVDLASGERTLLAEDSRCDASEVVRHPQTEAVQAVAFTYERLRWQVLDPELEADFARLAALEPGDLQVLSRTLADDRWVVAYTLDTSPVRYYLYDRAAQSARYLFCQRTALEGAPLAPMRPFTVRARDGLPLVGYYTLPLGSDSDGDGVPDRPLPLVFTPHGGPWWRDSWGFDPWHQWLANRGYAVMSVNFRASTGFGKAHLNAGDREWGGKVIEDQCDAVDAMVARGIADPARLAILGGSFGGYSVLAGLAFHPERYACGVDIVGVSNLETFLASIPPYWQPLLAMLHRRVGDPRTEEGRALLQRYSPLHRAEQIRRPLLVAQGANDPRVVKAESDQIVGALQARGVPVTYVLYPDEGHGFARPENNLSFYAVAEAFLARWLGGRCEPFGEDLTGASLEVLVGADHVPGLTEALGTKGSAA